MGGRFQSWDEDSENIASERYKNRHLRRPLHRRMLTVVYTMRNKALRGVTRRYGSIVDHIWMLRSTCGTLWNRYGNDQLCRSI